MSAAEILHTLTNQGFTLAVEGDRLTVSPSSRLTEPMRAEIEDEFTRRRAAFTGIDQQALDGFLGAAHALHVVARIAVMADGADLQKAVGSGDGAWSATGDGRGRGQLRATDGATVQADALARFEPTVYLYDNYPGGVGLSEPLFNRQAELLQRAQSLVESYLEGEAAHRDPEAGADAEPGQPGLRNELF